MDFNADAHADTSAWSATNEDADFFVGNGTNSHHTADNSGGLCSLLITGAVTLGVCTYEWGELCSAWCCTETPASSRSGFSYGPQRQGGSDDDEEGGVRRGLLSGNARRPRAPYRQIPVDNVGDDADLHQFDGLGDALPHGDDDGSDDTSSDTGV